jgi:hypothetical protein
MKRNSRRRAFLVPTKPVIGTPYEEITVIPASTRPNSTFSDRVGTETAVEK